MIWMPRNPSSFHLFPSVFLSFYFYSIHLFPPSLSSPRGAARNSLAWKFYDSNLRVSLHAQTSRHHLNLSFTHTQLNKGNDGRCEQQLLGYWEPLISTRLMHWMRNIQGSYFQNVSTSYSHFLNQFSELL